MPTTISKLPFMDLYLRTAGRSEVPEAFHCWSALALVGACLNDWVFYEKFRGDQLFPNMYIALVGKSGSGKDIAIGFASKFVRRTNLVYRYRGKLSGAGLADVLNRPEAKKPSAGGRPTVWLVLPELANGIGQGKLADDFIKRLTDLSKGEDDRYQESTRALVADDRDLDYKMPLFNGLFGSTKEWLVESVTGNAINSGFFARMLVIPAVVDPALRVTDPEFPDDYDDCVYELQERLFDISELRGPFAISERAWRIRDHWYQSRPFPEDERLEASWRRADDHSLKLGMVLEAMSGRRDRLLRADSYTQAQRYTHFAHNRIPDVLRWAARVEKTSGLEMIADLIQSAGRIAHSPLLKKATHRGIHAHELKVYLTTLTGRGDVKGDSNGNGGRVYEWAGG